MIISLDSSIKSAYIACVAKKKLTPDEVLSLLKKKQGDRSLREFAKELGVSAAHLSDVYRGNRQVGPTILGQIGLRKIVETNVSYEAVA